MRAETTECATVWRTIAPRIKHHSRNSALGKGDVRTRRGKIIKGSFGKSRLKKSKKANKTTE